MADHIDPDPLPWDEKGTAFEILQHCFGSSG